MLENLNFSFLVLNQLKLHGINHIISGTGSLMIHYSDRRGELWFCGAYLRTK
ncbi:MAG: hypothetical protein V7L21_11070 [Nostoc sp.]|uniref:hypothetical protein n=1 Tax=Nostoc sp. TaxID=1180 RepID=UPI002FF90020|nr:hypothetical protein [Nostoc sp. NMS9]